MTPEAKLQAAQPKTPEQYQLVIGLGVVVMIGVQEVTRFQRWSGDEIRHTYNTCFPMPDGQEWELTLRKKVVEE